MDPPDTQTLSFQPVKLPPLYSGGTQQVEILGVDALKKSEDTESVSTNAEDSQTIKNIANM